MDRVHGQTKDLSPRFIDFSVSFPASYTRLCGLDLKLSKRLVHDIRTCLSLLTQLILDYESICKDTKLLPLPHDLVQRCKIMSPCLQRLVFGYLLRHSWGVDTGRPAEEAMTRFLALQQTAINAYPPELAANEYKFFQTCYTRANPSQAQHLMHLHSIADGINDKTTLFTPTLRPSEATTVGFTAAQRASSHLPIQIPHQQLPVLGQQIQVPILASRRNQIQNQAMPSSANPKVAVVNNTKRVYRYVASFKISPQALKTTPASQQIKFDVTQDEFDRRASPKIGSKAIPSGTSLSFRLRCCAIVSASSNPTPNESDWVVKESSFPPHVYYSLNGTSLTYPKIDSHHKFAPVDVTDFVKVGTNTLLVSINRRSDDDQDLRHALALEGVTYRSEEQARAECLSRPPLTYAEVVDSIKQSLNVGSPEDGNDDDLVLVDPTVTITITEPFSSSEIFKIPVKGLHCTHRQPFDLDVFLHTRPISQKVPGYTKADMWKCPICGGDARPVSLVKDEFMVKVREELLKRKMLNTRTIVVHKNGSWEPKHDTPESGRPGDKTSGGIKITEREVIELD